MFRIANMEDMRPWNEYIFEKSHAVEFIALRGQRVFDRIILHHAFTTDDRHPFGIDGSRCENNLITGVTAYWDNVSFYSQLGKIALD